MNVHQIITGALNCGESVFAVGSIEGINFTACAVGCDIVILASDFQRVQIIPGCSTGYVQVACVDCCYETGKIAAAFYDLVRIYEPMALAQHVSKHKLDYQWFETCCFNVGSSVSSLSWNLEGMRLLVSTEKELQMFQHRMLSLEFYASDDADKADSGIQVKFNVDDEHSSNSSTPNLNWDCVWSNKLACPICFVKFSPDGSLFATSGPNDNLVKIWYQDCGGGLDPKEITFSFTYLPHPKAVVGFEWRKTGRYTPRGSVMNVLITWCRDNICRIWCETALPAEACGEMLLELKIDSSQIHATENGQAKNSPLKNAGHKVAHRLKTLKKMKKVKERKSDSSPKISPSVLLSQVPSASYVLDSIDLPPVVHFHLASSIHAENDCFLVPSLETGISDTTFAVHWLNNKELVYSLAVENLLGEALSFEQQTLAASGSTPTTTMNGFLTPGLTDEKNIALKHTKDAIDDDSCSSSSASDAAAISGRQYVSSTTDSYQNGGSHRDILDYKLEALLREWQSSSDILFTIHPLDGSLLVWTVDFLDNPSRQPQPFFSFRLPGVFPPSDAASLNHNVATFNPHDPIYVELLHRSNADKTTEGHTCPRDTLFPCHMCNTIFLLTNHRNGTLNLWHLNVDEKSKFCQILSVSHKSRMCGHRFRINAITCHPVLPLFLTTSHHNIRRKKLQRKSTTDRGQKSTQDVLVFNSEMILWKVNPVGPLCKSGGVRELARINSPELTAFSSISWIPAILPSSTLGSVSNSPSSCFVASDGKSLRVYQAVIDARALLAEVNYAKSHKSKNSAAVSPGSSGGDMSPTERTLSDTVNIVSSQSTARPGCIIELDHLDQSFHDWKNVQLLHVYHEQMILGDVHLTKKENRPNNPFLVDDSIVLDRSKASSFNDTFYLVALEKLKNETTASSTAVVHLWQLTMASQPPSPMKVFSPRKVSSMTQAQVDAEVFDGESTAPSTAKLFLYSKKVCTQQLHLPIGVKVIEAVPSVGHLPSSSLYPACRAPYLLVTACSDDKVRYWYCATTRDENSDEFSFNWLEWRLMSDIPDSSLELDGKILSVSCAYSGRFACSYDPSNSFDTTKSEKVNVEVAVYECESTGGTEWIHEDVLHLRDIRIPRVVHQMDKYEFHKESPVDEMLHTGFGTLMSRIPSISNMSGLRSAVSDANFAKQETIDLAPRQMVRLDWVSTEDGSYILTVAVGPKIFLFAPVAEDVAQKNVAMMHESETHHHQKRPLLRKASTIATPAAKKLIRWVNLRTIELDSADGLPPLPLMLSWVREGILIVGMETEMRIYNQWNISTSTQIAPVVHLVPIKAQTSETTTESKLLRPNALTATKLTISPSHSVLDLTKKAKEHPTTSASTKRAVALTLPKSKTPQNESAEMFLNLVRDEGLFEAARLATPLLPQYHPRQLMELLNAGKTKRVKAILLHILRCIRSKSQMWNEASNALGRRGSMNSNDGSDDDIGKSGGRLGRRGEMSTMNEDLIKDYIDLDSIPPLPLHALLAAENPPTALSNETDSGVSLAGNAKENYDGLFNNGGDEDELDIDFGDEDDENAANTDGEGGGKARRASVVSGDIASSMAFSAKHTRLLSKALTHIHLPGLSSVDQMHLLAVSDTLSSFSADVIDKLAQANAGFARTTFGDPIAGDQAAGTGIDAVDECGLRFLMAVKQHEYLLLCLPLKQRAHLRAKGLATSYIIWALHSDSENELLNSLACFQKASPKWEEFRTVGAGWWLKNLQTLRMCMEKIAKSAFQANNDPLDAAIYYLAMKKKNLLTHLYKSVKDAKMMEFFSNDFSEEKWKKAALKNAFVLIGKQRFEHAVAFFLLGGALNDALQVCVNNLNDLQLALVIVRLYESNIDLQQALVRELLCKHVLSLHDEDVNDKSSPDPFLRSMAYWLLKDYRRSLSTLIEDRTMFIDSPFVDSTNVSEVFNFYVYLRMHPLVVRQRLVDSGIQIGSTEKFLQVAKTMESQITAIERKLYFKTASTHFKSGCPLLALEVLCKLPKKVCLVPTPSRDARSSDSRSTSPVNTPTIVIDGIGKDSGPVDWSFDPAPLSKGVRFEEEELKLDWGDEGKNTESDEENGIVLKNVPSIVNAEKPTIDVVVTSSVADDLQTDIMAQQLKFIACLKIIMEELSTLASGFDVDGGQLRAQLYFWLEKEVDVLRQLCDYNVNLDETADDHEQAALRFSNSHDDDRSHSPSLFHEALKSDRANMTARWHQSNRRKIWLAANQQLLRTLLAYCSLHSSQGVGLASARMELLLLLQELHQEPAQRSQLFAPIPLQSSFPLLSASVASIKTDIAGPLRYLHCQISDLLKSCLELQRPPAFGESSAKMSIFYSLSQCLSSCIYESLCDIENLPLPKGAQSGHGYLLRRRRRKSVSVSEDLVVSSAPHKWPGAESLLAYLSRERDEDVPNLLLLLAESWVAIYLALFAYAFSCYDSRWLYRLVAHPVNAEMFAVVFGGGAEKKTALGFSEGQTESLPSSSHRDSSVERPIVDPSKVRARFNARLFGPSSAKTVPPTAAGRKQSLIITTKNQWVPPKKSILSWLSAKPLTDLGDVYDSDAESVNEESEEEDDGSEKVRERNTTHLDPNSYAWTLLRLALVRQGYHRIQQFLSVCGFEIGELGSISPLVHGCLRNLDDWKRQLVFDLDSFESGCPQNFLPNMSVERSSSAIGPPLHKYRTILDVNNTPFSIDDPTAGPVRRLWLYAVKQEHLMDLFIRYIFKTKQENGINDNVGGFGSAAATGPEFLKIAHREQDPIVAFAVSQAHFGWIVVSNGRELQEMDIVASLMPAHDWLQDPTEMDLALNDLRRDPLRDNDDYILVNPTERRDGTSGRSGASFLCKRNVAGVRRMEAHPSLPYYLSGSNDGSVRLWEWGVGQPLFVPRTSGQFAKVTRTRFNCQGNKFGIVDGDGSLCLWQISHGMTMKKPYLNTKCHTKTATDFTFLGTSSSLIATSGHSSGDYNVAMWDTLLPSHKALIHSWSCHPESATSLIFLPQQQTLMSGGRHGEVCIFDVRQRQLRSTLKPFDHAAVKAMVVHPNQDYFIVASSEGDIKVFSTNTSPQCLYTFSNEHSTKGGFSLRQANFSGQMQGVQQLYVDSDHRMYSCGADCSFKIRLLPSLIHDPHVF